MTRPEHETQSSIPDAFTFSSAEGDLFTIGASAQGAFLFVLPKTQLDPGIQDGLRCGLNHSSLVHALSVLDKGGKYTTRDFLFTLDASNSSTRFVFKLQNDPTRQYTLALTPDETGPIRDYFRSILAGAEIVETNRHEDQTKTSKIGPNSPCPCKSGKKYKKCCKNKPQLPPYPELDILRNTCNQEIDAIVAHAARNPHLIEDPLFWEFATRTLAHEGLLEKALKASDFALDKFKKDPVLLLNKAVFLGQAGRHTEALEITGHVPRDTQRLSAITGNLLFEQERYNECIPLYEKAIEEEPDFFLPYIKLIAALLATGSPTVEYWIEKARQALPRSPSIATSYVRFMLDSGRLDELADADWLLDLKSEAGRDDMADKNQLDPYLIVQAHLYRSAARINRDLDTLELERAVYTLESASNGWHLCDPAKVLSVCATNLGNLSMLHRAYARICERCRREGIGVIGPWNVYEGLALLKAGRKDEAVATLENCLESHPENQEALWGLWWGLDDLGRTDEAIKAAEKLYKIDPRRAHLDYNLGFLYSKAGRFAEARYHYEIEHNARPNNFLAIENLAFVLLVSGDTSSASTYWSRFQDTFNKIYSDRLDEPTLIREQDFIPVAPRRFLTCKNDKWRELEEKASAAKESPTYADDILKKNYASEPHIGSECRVGDILLSVEQLTNLLSAGDDKSVARARQQLDMQRRGDYSVIAQRLRTSLPGWDQIPPEATRSLIEGERRMSENIFRDHSPEVVCFAKAVEITLFRNLFVQYRTHCQDLPDITLYISSAKKLVKTERLARFIESGQPLELGSMMFILGILGGKTETSVFLVGALKSWLLAHPRGTAILSKEFRKHGHFLKEYRNPAAHSHSFESDVAQQVRTCALECLAMIT